MYCLILVKLHPPDSFFNKIILYCIVLYRIIAFELLGLPLFNSLVLGEPLNSGLGNLALKTGNIISKPHEVKQPTRRFPIQMQQNQLNVTCLLIHTSHTVLGMGHSLASQQ